LLTVVFLAAFFMIFSQSQLRLLALVLGACPSITLLSPLIVAALSSPSNRTCPIS